MDHFTYQQFAQKKLKKSAIYHQSTAIFLLIYFIEGLQSIAISLTTPLIGFQLNIPISQGLAILTSYYYIGFIGGAAISIMLSKKFGRRNVLILGCLLQIISTLLLSQIKTQNYAIWCRLFYGISFGWCVVIVYKNHKQFMPLKERGLMLFKATLADSFGKSIAAILGYLYLSNQPFLIFDFMCFLSAFSLMLFLLVIIFFRQSYIELFFNKKDNEALMMINQICKQNNFNQLEQEQKQILKNWMIRYKQNTMVTQNEIKNCCKLQTFNKQIFLIAVSWFIINFIIYGQLFITPFLISQLQNAWSLYIWMCIGQIPTVILIYIFQKKQWRRKKILTFLAFITGILFLLVNQNYNILLFSLLRFFQNSLVLCLNHFSLETLQKTQNLKNYSIYNSFGIFGTYITQYFMIIFYSINNYTPFLILGILCMISAITINFSREETQFRPLQDFIAYKILDEQKKQMIQQLSQTSSKINQLTQ